MKRAAAINMGESFVTLRATTDRPSEIREALAARDVQHVFKGDQNQAWDAVLANHCLARAVGDSGADLTFFIQDERLGTPDARLARRWRRTSRRYALTEDYYRGRAGAVWEHQDVSYGCFFTEAVSPEQYREAGLDLHRAAVLWAKHSKECMEDGEWLSALAALGVWLPGAGDAGADAATRLGPAVNRADLAEAFAESAEAALYYAFTKTDGLYGIVPVDDDNVTLSSIPAAQPELREAGRWLLVRAAARGAMRLAATPAHRRQVSERARELAAWAEEFFSTHPEASVADFQEALGCWLTAQIFPTDRLELDRTSRFTRVEPGAPAEGEDLAESLHFFLDLALRHPLAFTEAYNEALNRVGFGLQRVKYDPRTGRYTPPFFVELAPGGPGTPVYRYGLELSGRDRVTVRLANGSAGDLLVEAGGPVGSAAELVRVLYSGLPGVTEISVVGKAAAFAAELQRSPRGLGLPRQGSKYAPMVDHLLAGLRQRGVLDQPAGLLIRIGLNALDRLEALGETPLRLPRFLRPALGRDSTCRAVAEGWRETASRAGKLIRLLGSCPVGQHVHLARLLALSSRGLDPAAAAAEDPRLGAVLARLAEQPRDRTLLLGLGRDLPEEAAATVERLSGLRAELLRRRRQRMAEVAAATLRGRVVRPEDVRQLDRDRERVECQLQLLVAAYIRRLWQQADSLPYLNDRPYTLALYLLFGREIFPPICRQVEFDVEWVSPIPDETFGRPCGCGCPGDRESVGAAA